MFAAAIFLMSVSVVGLFILKQMIYSRVRVLDVKAGVRQIYRTERRQMQLAQLTPLTRALAEAQYCLQENKVLKERAYAKVMGMPDSMAVSKTAEARARRM